MQKIKFLLVLLLGILILPFGVLAEEDSQKVNVYFFRGEGCPHCEEAEEWFDSIQEEYGEYFTIVDYETWQNKDNAQLMEDVAEARKEKVEGVPYIIIGDKSWNGFSQDYTDAMISEIESQYKISKEDRYDIMEMLDTLLSAPKDYTADILILITFIVVIAGIVVGVIFARKKTS